MSRLTIFALALALLPGLALADITGTENTSTWFERNEAGIWALLGAIIGVGLTFVGAIRRDMRREKAEAKALA